MKPADLSEEWKGVDAMSTMTYKIALLLPHPQDTETTTRNKSKSHKRHGTTCWLHNMVTRCEKLMFQLFMCHGHFCGRIWNGFIDKLVGLKNPKNLLAGACLCYGLQSQSPRYPF